MRLIEETVRIPFQGWDFSVLGDRLVLEPPGWSFEAIADEAAGRATSMLDMGTGGGEWLSARRRPSLTVATESWPPNVPIAAARLRPLGVHVVQDEGAVENVAQQAAGALDGRLPFGTAAFDLVLNRHEAFVAAEVRRVLRDGGAFVTQQASSSARELHQLLGLAPPAVVELELDLAAEQVDAAGLRVERAEAGAATAVFADVGALAWYLHHVPWAVPGFTVEEHRDALLRLHGRPIRVAAERFYLEARAD